MLKGNRIAILLGASFMSYTTHAGFHAALAQADDIDGTIIHRIDKPEGPPPRITA